MRSFHKMHGLGNDFALFDARESPLPMTPALARAIGDRATGIGCDQIIILEPSTTADLAMRIWNADGSEVEACGNATRCVPTLLGAHVRVETKGGLLDALPTDDGASVDMGTPRFDWDAIPLAYAMDTADMPVGWEALDHPMAVNVGNPHIIFFVEDVDAVPLDRLGPLIENDPLFPERVNVTVAHVSGPNHLKARTWERGAGLTRACGTAACATGVAAIRRGLVKGPVRIALPGGALDIDWAPGGTIRMTGPATYVYRGEIDLEALV